MELNVTLKMDERNNLSGERQKCENVGYGTVIIFSLPTSFETGCVKIVLGTQEGIVYAVKILPSTSII